ncbi:DUF3034 family protein [Qipengyuania spongiae]|uniref:DUF3034 family protein n=1 Tax=Qipengyuania spongiae TaxID=2909673 RepID=A0ABY5T2E5_9SPHN|nr:DUF3034 family protein [Qipengyuania spongiae]UVI40271.1 DUF3034 family protein [Qipengyuania spongiae]
MNGPGVSASDEAATEAFLPPDQAAEPFAPSIDYSGKLLLTNGVTTIEGTSGGGIASWATLAGMEERGLGISAHATLVLLPDFTWQSHGVAASFGNRIELSYARQNFDTNDAGAALGLGEGYTFSQDVFGAKFRLLGDLVYGEPLLPQISLGVQHKRSRNDAVVAALGAAEAEGTDVYVSATKLLLSRSILANGTLRLTKANQNGLLGFGSAAHPDYGLQFEGSLAYQFSRRFALGAEYRSKPDNLGLGEDGWMDLFAAYAPTDFLTLTAAYADLGSIATFEEQRGAFLQAQIAF